MIDALVTFLRARLDEDEQVARAVPGPSWEHRQIRGTFDDAVVFEDYIAVAEKGTNRFVLPDVSSEMVPYVLAHDPVRVLREVEAKRRIVDIVMSWPHRYVDEDCWYSCGLAVDPSEPNAEPGSGCCRDDDRGRCTCALEQRQQRMISPFAAIYADHPDYRAEWAPNG